MFLDPEFLDYTLRKFDAAFSTQSTYVSQLITCHHMINFFKSRVNHKQLTPFCLQFSDETWKTNIIEVSHRISFIKKFYA